MLTPRLTCEQEITLSHQPPAASNGLLNLGIGLPISFDIALLPTYSGAVDCALLLSWRWSARRLPIPRHPRRLVDQLNLRQRLRTPSGCSAWGSILLGASNLSASPMPAESGRSAAKPSSNPLAAPRSSRVMSLSVRAGGFLSFRC